MKYIICALAIIVAFFIGVKTYSMDRDKPDRSWMYLVALAVVAILVKLLL